MVAEDGESITSELYRAFATVDGVNMPIEELDAKHDGHDSLSTMMSVTRYKALSNRTRNSTSYAVSST